MARENFLWVLPGFTASFSCSVSAFRKPRYRATCLHQAGGRVIRGEPFLAIKPVRLARHFAKFGPVRILSQIYDLAPPEERGEQFRPTTI
jgi:hypothetical protein